MKTLTHILLGIGLLFGGMISVFVGPSIAHAIGGPYWIALGAILNVCILTTTVPIGISLMTKD